MWNSGHVVGVRGDARRANRRAVVILVTLLAGWLHAVSPAAAAESTFRFAQGTMQVPEGMGLVRITVERTDLPVSRATLDYRTEGATAKPGTDYEESSGTLVFEVGETSATFTVPLIDDDVPEPREHFLLRLIGRSSAGPSAPLTILDDDNVVAAEGQTGGASQTDVPEMAATATRPAAVAPSGVGSADAVAIRSTSRRSALPVRPGLRRVTVRQSPSAPFELRPAPPSGQAPVGYPGDVDPLLVALAGLVFARVAAEVWFRFRTAAI